MRRALLFLSLVLVPQLASAQDSSDISGVPVPSWAEAVISSFEKPLHPIIGGVTSGGGVGLGVGYDSNYDQRWYKGAEAIVTVRRNWMVEGEFGRRSSTARSQIGLFGGVRHMNRLDYFGIGRDTLVDDRSAFRLRETTIGTRGWFRPMSRVRVGGSVAMYKPYFGPGTNRAVPSIEQRFAASTLPAFVGEPTFGRYRGFVELVHPYTPPTPASEESNGYRGTYQVAVEAFRDRDSGQHDFHLWEAEVQQRIPGFKDGQRLTIHGFVASTNSGADIPFYMLYTLGGSGGLKSFRPDLLGSDGTRATLRSFRTYRFRDRNLVLMQAEYRIPIVESVHATVFVDAGQVAPRTSELFKHVRTGTGVSLSYMRKGRTIGRVDVGFGSGEGVQVFWSFGAFQD
jgi:Omp85 superfamily domain